MRKIFMDFSRPHTKIVAMPQIYSSSKIGLNNTLAYCTEMKQMFRRLQGIPSGCSSCGKGKK